MFSYNKRQYVTRNNKQQKRTTFLQTYQNKKHHKNNYKNADYGKRTSLFTSNKKASITVETALVLPIFLFVIIHLLSMIEMIRLYSNVEMSLHQIGCEMAIYAYVYEEIGEYTEAIPNVMESFAWNQLYVKDKILDKMGREYLNTSPLQQGERGIQVIRSKIMEEDITDIIAEYKVSPIFTFGIRNIPLINRCRMRAWTGYDNIKAGNIETESELVYVTETGSVYHRNRDCTHLQLKIQSCGRTELERIRNENGAKYYPCELCGKDKTKELIWIAEQGNRYHNAKECSGLKRTVRAIPIEEVGNRTPCLRCGQK